MFALFRVSCNFPWNIPTQIYRAITVQTIYLWWGYMGLSKNRETPQNGWFSDGKPLFFNGMIWGEFTHHFVGNIPICDIIWWASSNPPPEARGLDLPWSRCLWSWSLDLRRIGGVFSTEKPGETPKHLHQGNHLKKSAFLRDVEKSRI